MPAFPRHWMKHWRPFLFTLLLLAGALSARAGESLNVTNETPVFTLDTRLAGDPNHTNTLVAQAESPAFFLDTRLPSGEPSVGLLSARAESAAFTLDTQLALEGVKVGLTTVTESAAFTLDTRLPADNAGFASLLVRAESPTFWLDTRLPGENPLFALLIKQAESAVFPLDTRLPQQNPLYTSLIITAEYSPFTIDTLNGWLKTPAQILDGGSTGGKARFSPDGLRLAKTDGSRVLMWNLHSTKTNVSFAGHSGEVVSLEFSPMGDQLLTGGTDGTLRWWDTASRSELGRKNPTGSGTVYAAYASDGARLLATRGTNASFLRVPDMQSLQELAGLDGSASAVALCPEGLALVGSSAREALLWDTATGALRQRFSHHTHLITAAAFYPGGGQAMTASLDGTIRIWSTTNGTELMQNFQSTPVADAVLSADGELIATCDTGTPGTAYLWDGRTGAMMRFFTDTVSDASQITGVAISPDHTLLATTHVDGRLRLWNTGLSPRPAQSITELGLGTNAPVTLRSHGLYYFELAAQPGRSLVVSLEAASAATASSLKLAGGAATSVGQGLSADAEFANLGARTFLSASGSGTNATPKTFRPAPNSTDIAAFRMTAMKGKLPSEYDYETFAQASVTNLHCEMPVATSTSDKVYVLVFAPYLSAGSIQARIRAEYADFHLSNILPALGGNKGNVTARIQGTGITPDTTARLVGPGGAVANSQIAMWGDPTKAWFTFDLSGAPAGSYQVEISKPGVAPLVLANAFEVVNAVGPQLQASLTAPAVVRTDRDYVMTLKYANVGDVDVAAPLFVVVAGDGQPSIHSIPSTYGLFAPNVRQVGGTPSTPKAPQVEILGLNQDGPPGLLPPGATCEIPLYFYVDPSRAGHSEMSYNLFVLKADSILIDWTELEARLRPTDLAADLWAAVWSNFKSSIGSTWADYLRALDTQAHLLALANQPSYDMGNLLAALFSQAIGAPYRRTLAAAVDAQAPAPALPLQFSRFATDGLEHRFTVGPLGRGWSHNYEYALTQPTNGVVVIRTPGGGARRFALGADSVWHGETADYATLVATGGGFALLEKEGISWQFDAGGQLLSIEEPNHNRVTLSYSGGQLTGLSHSAGPSSTLEYSAQGRLARLTDHAGQVTTYEYDAAGEYLLRVVAPGSVTNRYTYQPATGSPSDHALTSVTFPDGTHQFFAWNAQGRLAEQSRDGGAERLQFTYDATGTVTMRDAQNAVTTLRLGTRGQLLQMTDALGRPVTFNYDPSFNLTRLTGPAGDTTELAYDTQGNASQIVNPLGQSVSLGHAALGRLSNLRDARGQLTDFNYDPQGNLTGIGYADASAETFGYDTSGDVTTWTNRRGQAIQFTRNPQGQLTRKAYPDGRTFDYAYGTRGQLTNVTDSVQGITSLSYDARGFLISITYPDGKGFTFEYNAAGRRTRRLGHDGYTLNYGYDAAGRLETLTEGATNEMVRYVYDSAGRLTRETKGNGTFTTYVSDLAAQVVALTNHAPDGVAQSYFNYTYDAKGNRLTMTTAAGVTSYGYDALNQLTGVTYPGGRHVTYAYDAAGNRTLVSDNGTNTAYSANSLNQYTQAGAATFGYDPDGNMTSRTHATGTTTYDYDAENRLVRVATPSNGVFQYTYDALGNRTAVAHDGVTNRYLHDPIGLVDVAAEYDTVGSLVARYDHALGLVARSDALGKPAFYSFDALGNTRELTGTGGSLLNVYDYDAFGAATVASETVGNAFRFVGRLGVAEEGANLHYMRSRFYSAASGGFVSPDPTLLNGGDANLYRYAQNNPVNQLDPSGKFAQIAAGAALGGVFYVFENGVKSGVGYLMDGKWEWKGNWVGFGASVFYGGMTAAVPVAGVGALGHGIVRVANTVMANVMDAMGSSNKDFNGGDFIAGLVGSGLGSAFGGSLSKWVLGSASRAITEASYEELIARTVEFAGVVGVVPLVFQSAASTAVVRPRDPNDKIGPAGIGPNRVVSSQDEMEYMVRFENFATASAPVQELIVVDYLDAGLDWTTARFKEMAYGGRIITPAVGSQSFVIRDTPPADSPAITGIAAAQMVVNASGSINPQMGRMEWRLTAIDTNTSFLPLDALTGFLPPEDGTGRGQGYVKLAVRPKSNLPIGTAITNIATIIFDGNDPINTPAVWNIIGDIPPLAATIAYLPGQIMAGTPFTYTVGLTNTGTSNVLSVILTNALPPGMTVLNTTATFGSVTVTNGALVWDLGTLASGAGATLTITASATQSGTFANNFYYSGGSGLAIYTAPSDLVVVEPPRPQLTIRLLSADVELSWPTNASAFRLQSADSIAPAAWANLTNTPAASADLYRVTIGAPDATKYYRLVKP